MSWDDVCNLQDDCVTGKDESICGEHLLNIIAKSKAINLLYVI